MDNPRLILFIALSFVLLLLWEAWQQDYGRPPVPQAQAPAAETAGAPEPAADLPPAQAPAVETQAPPEPVSSPLTSAERVRVVTDVLDVEIDTVGGDLRRAELPAYPVAADRPGEAFRLMDDALPDLFVAQSGLRTRDSTEPTHHVRYEAGRGEYRMDPGQDELRVPLRWTSPEGVEVTKVFTFRRGDYLVDVEHRVRNGTGGEWRGRQYRQFQRTAAGDGDGGSRFIYTYTGGVIYSPEEKYEKIEFSDMEEQPLSRAIQGGWAAMIQHYFLGAWIPGAGETSHYYSKALPDGRYVLGLVSPPLAVPAGGEGVFASRLYVGPKEQRRLEEIAEGLELTVDYGVLTILAKPLYWLLEHIHALIGNWGWGIVLLTMLIKLAFYKLSETSYRSMAHMRKLAPRMQALKERHGDDKQRLQQAMMELYKKEKINPLGGCLPILVQIPVFIALYWVLLESVELRQAPFILWLDDLSSKDPYFVLPVLMGATMLIQQKLNPAPMDPIQAKVMMVLPVVFTVFFAFFPSGLVLYWVVNNTLSILQQWVITRRIERAAE